MDGWLVVLQYPGFILNCLSPSFFQMIQVLEVARSIAHLRCSHSYDTRGKRTHTDTYPRLPLPLCQNINFHSQSEINVIKLSILKVSVTIFCHCIFNFVPFCLAHGTHFHSVWQMLLCHIRFALNRS